MNTIKTDLKAALLEYFGFDSFKGEQEKVIANLLSNKNTFVMTRGMDACVWVYPLNQWLEIEKSLRSLSSLSKIHRTFVRNTARYATPSTYDKQGRIMISPSLISYSSIKRDVLIIGMINKIEILLLLQN